MRLFSIPTHSIGKYIQYEESRQLVSLKKAGCEGAKGEMLMRTKTIKGEHKNTP